MFWKILGTHFGMGFANKNSNKVFLGYELVQGCSQRRQYSVMSIDCDSQTKNATRFCSMSLKGKEPTALSLGNILVYGTLVQSSIITGTFWPAG
jgi:hypothetical protein